MKIENSGCNCNINSKSFINYIHPSLKIILVILIFKIIFSLKLNIFNLNSDLETKNITNIMRILFSFIYFLFFIFIFFFLVLVINYPLGKIIKQILGFKFIFFFSLLFHSQISEEILPKENFFSFKTWNLQLNTFFFIFVFLYISSLFLFTKKNYKNFYFVLFFLFFFILPYFSNNLLFLNKKTSYLYFEKTYFYNIFLIFLRIFLFLMVNILMKETTSFIEINDGLEIILKPLKKLKLPVEILTLMLSLIFMAIPFLLEETQKILKSQLSRGLNFYTKNIFKKIYYLLSLLVPIFVLSFKKSFVLANAMETRGYVLNKKRTKLALYKMNKNDYLILFLFSVLFLWSFL